MSMLDRIRDGFKYLDKNGLKHLIEKIKLHDVHWTGTHAEYEAVKDTLPDYTILHFTDDYDEGGLSKVYLLGYGRYGVSDTVTINTSGRHTMIVCPHTGSSTGYQAVGLANAYVIDSQIRHSDLPTIYGTQIYGNSSSPGEFVIRRVALFKVTAVTQDTVTITTNATGVDDVGFAWFHIFVI